MSRWRGSRIAGALAAGCLLAGCNPYAAPLKSGGDLAVAGFIAHPADTTARQSMMNLLPTATMTYRLAASGPIMLYADPLACGCVYFGDALAYRQYTVSHHETPAMRQAMIKDNNQHPGWDWSVWSPAADPSAVAGLAPSYVRPPGWQ